MPSSKDFFNGRYLARQQKTHSGAQPVENLRRKLQSKAVCTVVNLRYCSCSDSFLLWKPSCRHCQGGAPYHDVRHAVHDGAEVAAGGEEEGGGGEQGGGAAQAAGGHEPRAEEEGGADRALQQPDHRQEHHDVQDRAVVGEQG